MEKKTKNFPCNTLAQAKIVCDGWRELLPKMDVPHFSLAEFEQIISDAEQKAEIAEKISQERRQVVVMRDRQLKEIRELTKRIRAAAWATFGMDSKESDKFGGKPVRFRKQYRPSDRD